METLELLAGSANSVFSALISDPSDFSSELNIILGFPISLICVLTLQGYN